MRKRNLVVLCLVILLALALATVAQAGVTKYGFNDVVIDGTIVEIEASVKTTNKGDYSTCTYFSDDYIDVLGYYQEAESAGDTAEEVLQYCIDHFNERTK